MTLDPLDQWLDQYKRKSEDVQARVNVALEFLKRHYPANQNKILSEIKCIDFSKAVLTPSLKRGQVLIGYKDERVSPYKASYFSLSGYQVERLGVAPASNLKSNPKILDKKQMRYKVLVDIPVGEVLQSTCAAAVDNWSIERQRVLAGGGGLQYLIPRMERFLRYMEG